MAAVPVDATPTDPTTNQPPSAATLDDWQKQLTDLQTQYNNIDATLQFQQQQYAANHYGGQTPGQFASIIAPEQSQESTIQATIANIKAKIQAALQPPLSQVAAAVQSENNSALQGILQPTALGASSGPAIFVPAGGGSSPSIFSSPLVLIGLAVAAYFGWKFLRRKK